MRDSTALMVGLGIAIVAGLVLVKKFADGTLNPTSPNNLAYSGVNSVGATITGDKDFNLGGWMWELFNPSAVATERAAAAPAPGAAVLDPFDQLFIAEYSKASYPVTGSGGAAFGIYPKP